MTLFSCMYFLSLFMILQRPATFEKTCSSCNRINFNVKNGVRDRALGNDRRLKNTMVENDSQCFYECYKDCKCLSFNVCGETCQLNGANKLSAKTSFQVKGGCRYYDFPVAESTCETESPKHPGICCALQPHLCFNGGSCDVNTSDTTRRFNCKCPSGYYGDQCEIERPKTCLDYWTSAIKPISRDYKLEDQSGNPYQVYCDFDSEEGIAWTLVESFSMNNEALLVRFPFTMDHPLNETNVNWDLFRLSKMTMKDISSRSTFWRGTCSYPIYGVDFRDYIRVRVSVLDPTVFIGGVTYNSKSCVQIDFLDVRGTRCLNCTTTIFQLDNEMLYVASFWGRQFNGCSFNSSNVEYMCGKSQRARWLGLYWRCSDPSYRCTMTPSSTTQFWFGELK